MIALKWNHSIDRKIFEGTVDDEMNKLSEIYKNKASKFDESKIDSLINLYGNEQKIYPNDKYKNIRLHRKNKFFSFIINEKYQGTNLSVHELSSVLTRVLLKSSLKCYSMTQFLGLKLLINYGTKEQKKIFAWITKW